MVHDYTLRVSVKTLGKKPVTGIEQPFAFELAGHPATIEQPHRFLILKVSGFGSEEEALRALPQVKAALWNLALDWNVAFVPEFLQREITRSKDPVAAGKNLAANFNAPDFGPVHGLVEGEGVTVYQSSENIKFLGLGEMTGSVSTGVDRVIASLQEGAGGSAPADDKSLSTAVDLYLAQFFETSSRARLLTLMMVLEVLAPVTQKHAAATEIIQTAKAQLSQRLQASQDPEERDALEALNRELDFRRETSIRRRVRQLVLDARILGEEERKALAKQVVEAYDLRGQIAHTGTADPSDVGKALDEVLRACKLLLKARIGLC